MFSNTHSVLLVLLVITYFHSHTAGNDEFVTHFCLNMDTPEHMDSSTVQGRKNSTHFSYLATKSPVPQDYTEEQLHTVTSHGISATTHPAQQDYKKNPNTPDMCCFKFEKNESHVTLITVYKETATECPNPGVIFTLQDSDSVCADPRDEWVKNKMKKLDQRPIGSSTQPQPNDGNVKGPNKCCFKYQTSQIHVRFIKAYQETERQCTKPGVIFTLKDGRQVCADPNVEWVKNIMKKLTSV
ncbi:uncharacterized protein LOC113524000 [Pangasianodon hypophthalmus]|uniref:uncharacterized protein LOC113524000 n=1 Tax=Pangasianodon hypophthalmus TaxID=310915 RepID=UPI000EFF2532|nr:uncharacterized protein LOC113524000 [Pangasianodon hypophthalmus]